MKSIGVIGYERLAEYIFNIDNTYFSFENIFDNDDYSFKFVCTGIKYSDGVIWIWYEVTDTVSLEDIDFDPELLNMYYRETKK